MNSSDSTLWTPRPGAVEGLGPTPIVVGSEYRVDSVIESSLLEIVRSKNFALINLCSNFCETTMYNKIFIENLVAVH